MVISTVTFDRILRLMAKQPSMRIDAIKFYRETVPGTGLAEAKQYIENLAAAP
jgi:ribosomal protein L7/L12